MKKVILVIVIVSFFYGCGSGSSSSTSSTPSPDTPTINKGSTAVADVLSVGPDSVQVYIPSIDTYTSITMSTGAYTSTSIFYSEANCTGTPYIMSWWGPLGKSVIYGNGVYYKITGSSVVTSAPYLSAWENNNCFNTNSTIENQPVATVQVVTQPYNFTPMAPLSITFN